MQNTQKKNSAKGFIPPKNNTLCVTYKTLFGKIFYITQNKNKDKYTLWEQKENDVIKIKTTLSPLLLEREIQKK